MISRRREMRDLARRVFQRWQSYRVRNPGRSVPISDALSRIMAHEPDYPRRQRASTNPRPPLTNPGIFTVQQIAHDLETTVGDLLGEPGYVAAHNLVTEEQRRTLRNAVRILTDVFDLRDPRL